MTYEQKDNLRTTTGVSLMFLIAGLAYIFLPFLWVYGVAVGISVALMITDLVQSDPKQGMMIFILKWTTLVPVLNLVPLLLIPVFSVVNVFFKDD